MKPDRLNLGVRSGYLDEQTHGSGSVTQTTGAVAVFRPLWGRWQNVHRSRPAGGRKSLGTDTGRPDDGRRTSADPESKQIWVACAPVHRRCDEPMFSLSNHIAYDGWWSRKKPPDIP